MRPSSAGSMSNRPGSAGGSSSSSLSNTHIPVGLQFTVSSLLTDTVGLLLPLNQPSGVTLHAILRLPAHCAMRAHISCTEWLNAAPSAMGLSEEVAVRLFEAFSLLWQHQGQRFERRIEATRALLQAMAGNNSSNNNSSNNNSNNRSLSYSAVTAQRAVSLPGFMIFLAAQTFLERAHTNNIQPGSTGQQQQRGNNNNPQITPPETYAEPFLLFVRENLSSLMSFLCMGTPGRICVADLAELRVLFREWDNGQESSFGTKLSFLWGQTNPNSTASSNPASQTIESQVLIQLLRSRLCLLSELRGGGSGAASSLLLYRGVSHQTVVTQAGNAVPRCSDMHNCVRIQRCNQSTFYVINQPLPSVVISRCQNCVIFLGPVSGVLVVDRCESCQIVALCSGLVVQGGRNVTLFVGTNTPPILVPPSDSSSSADGNASDTSSQTSSTSPQHGNVQIAPFNTCYPLLEEQCLQARVNPKLNLFAEKNRNSAQWSSSSSTAPTSNNSNGFVSLLPPSQFCSLVVPSTIASSSPSNSSSTTATTRVNPAAMPPEYSSALQERVSKCTDVSSQLLNAYRTLENNGRSDLAEDLRKKVQTSFIEWLEASGQVQGLADLLTVSTSASASSTGNTTSSGNNQGSGGSFGSGGSIGRASTAGVGGRK